MTDQAPATEKPTASQPSALRRWAPTGVLSLVLIAIGWMLSQQLPPIIEGFLDHPPVVASVIGQKTQVYLGYKRRRIEKDFAVVKWTDDQGRDHRDLLANNELTYGRRYETGDAVAIRYALAPDGTTRLIWERQPTPYLTLLVLLAGTISLAGFVFWLLALRAALRGRPAPAPTPDSGQTP